MLDPADSLVAVIDVPDTFSGDAQREDAGADRAGASYVFGRDQAGANNWGEVKKLTASDAQADDQFGRNVAVSGDTAVVAAYLEDAGGGQAGAAYVFLPGPVGGIAELPDVDAAPLGEPGSSGKGRGLLVGITAAITAAAVALGGAAWYARRRRG